MYRQKTAPRQLLLHCSSTDIRVGMRYLHFPHPCGSDVRAGFCSCKTCTSHILVGRIPHKGAPSTAVAQCRDA